MIKSTPSRLSRYRGTGGSLGAHARERMRGRISFTVMTVALAVLMFASGAVEVRAQTAPGSPRNLKIEDTIFAQHSSFSVHSGLSVSWEAPASDGGSPITGYKIRYEYDRPAYTNWHGQHLPKRVFTREVGVPSDLSVLPHTIGPLRANAEHRVSVIATNAAGDGLPSAEVTVTPMHPDDTLLAFIEEDVVKVHEGQHPWLRKTLTHMKNEPDFDLSIRHRSKSGESSLHMRAGPSRGTWCSGPGGPVTEGAVAPAVYARVGEGG